MKSERADAATGGATDSAADRRRHSREVVFGGIVEIGGVSYPIKNWNEQAVLIAPCNLNCDLGDTMHLRLSIPMERGAISFSCDGHVVRADAKSQEVVLQFAELTTADHTALMAYFTG